jgi:hypothetical protein
MALQHCNTITVARPRVQPMGHVMSLAVVSGPMVPVWYRTGHQRAALACPQRQLAVPSPRAACTSRPFWPSATPCCGWSRRRREAAAAGELLDIAQAATGFDTFLRRLGDEAAPAGMGRGAGEPELAILIAEPIRHPTGPHRPLGWSLVPI